MNSLKINIGLNNLPQRYHNPYTGSVDAQLVVDLCKALFYRQPSNAPKGKGTDLKYTINEGEYKGETEPTLIIEGKTLETNVSREISLLCALLGQECIAYKLNGKGGLVYKNSSIQKLKFNNEYFLEL